MHDEERRRKREIPQCRKLRRRIRDLKKMIRRARTEGEDYLVREYEAALRETEHALSEYA
jgi:hypothetical protein